jgi:hypothetical protein
MTSRWLGRTSISGLASGPVQIVYTGGVPIRVSMQASTTRFRIGPIATESARADVTVRPGRLEVVGIDGRAYKGVVTGTVDLTFGDTLELRTDLAGKGADLARIIRLAGPDLPIASNADVTFKIAGDPGSPATWIGGGTFSATPAPAATGAS